jgi:hypothetical protein
MPLRPALLRAMAVAALVATVPVGAETLTSGAIDDDMGEVAAAAAMSRGWRSVAVPTPVAAFEIFYHVRI